MYNEGNEMRGGNRVGCDTGEGSSVGRGCDDEGRGTLGAGLGWGLGFRASATITRQRKKSPIKGGRRTYKK